MGIGRFAICACSVHLDSPDYLNPRHTSRRLGYATFPLGVNDCLDVVSCEELEFRQGYIPASDRLGDPEQDKVCITSPLAVFAPSSFYSFTLN